MNILLLLIPLSIVLVSVAAWAFLWAVKNKQFDDLDARALSLVEPTPTNTDAKQSDEVAS